MITSFSASNFKAFKTMSQINLKKLTILVGKNSCGKSSILQSLLLLKQTLDSSSNSPLCLEDKYLKCSNLRELSFGLPANNANIDYTFNYQDNDKSNTGANIDIEFFSDTEQANIEIKKFILKKDDEIFDFNNLSLEQVIKHTQEGFKVLFNDIKNSEMVKIKYDRFIPESIKHILGPDVAYDLPIDFLNANNLMDSVYEFSKFIKSIKYLSPIRAFPERAYVHYTEVSQELNMDGRNVAHVLYTKRSQKVKWDNKSISLANAVNESLKCLKLIQSINPEHSSNILYKIDVKELVSNNNISLVDVGFGYSQVLPVILFGLLNNENNLSIIEQPEIHLHPSCAANLADLFLTFIKDDRRFLLETHSTEFINRLRLRVIENPSLRDSINIVFVEPTEKEGSQIKQFEIDENGNFPEWPDGFIDESEKLAEAILQARLNK